MKKSRIVVLILVVCLLCCSLPHANAAELPNYNIPAAVSFALSHWSDGIGECAQFVSRCLAAGGIYVPNTYNYYSSDEPRYWGSVLGPYTNPYICAAALLKWLSQSYEVIVDPDISEMELGDIIFMDGGNPDGHTGIITGFSGSMPLYTAHNRDCCNAPVYNLVNFLVKMTPRVIVEPPAPPELCEKGEDCAGNIFMDMPAPDDWSHDYIEFSVEHELFTGTSETTFSPSGTMTRAMLVTVLWRYDGSLSGFSQSFVDVPNGLWYTDAVAWASTRGVVDGVGGGRFDPDGAVTREQAATILYRYAKLYQIDTAGAQDFGSYVDIDAVSGWALDAMRWAVSNGVITGSSGQRLLPQANATRAQVAAILTRFILNI